ncbi:response regulator [Spirosoma sp. HMF4905]|uniref:Response regulator n=1 Tax=Spirosoma arboris TaxID=2682092 RepID=A0A7K1SIW6_9BACT|nr:response regulator [Spirosoma arboris]MVM33674.1 response regulator [Spirosoma arboris]
MKTILVIDDTLEMRENITEILKLAQYTVVSASNGKQGIEFARQFRPDLILCDIMMPELDGYGVRHILSKDPAMAGIPFIFLSAKAEVTDFRQGMDLGADDYLIKPFENVVLLNVVALRLSKEKNESRLKGFDTLRQALTHGYQASQRLCETYPTSQLKKKQILFQAGSVPNFLYFIRHGQVKLIDRDEAGNTFITRLVGDGDFVGYLALLRGSTYYESAELLTDAEVCSIPKDDFLTLLYNSQDVANLFVRSLALNVTEAQERLLKLAYQTVRKRVAEALLLVQRKFYAMPAGLPDVPAPASSLPMSLSRENWSQLVGASTEAVIRTLSDFRNEGLIDITGTQITLLDIQKLMHLKN